MTAFDVREFLAAPTFITFDQCRKADLLGIAKYFGLSVSSNILKKEIKSLAWDKLVAEKVFVLPIILPSSPSEELSNVSIAKAESLGKTEGSAGAEAKDEKPPFTLPRYEAVSPSSSGSMSDARLKFCLARLQIEAEERAREAQAQDKACIREQEFQLSIRKLEIEAETRVKLRQLELQNAAAKPAEITTTALGPWLNVIRIEDGLSDRPPGIV
ncbi:hypothetical protein SKAU_G00155480 [Synaphobranchus kaupii]|uniref:Uncharacterized protein n=1 Tax=Synaphobranchus kaupii TaxID=118154 RepID=A0A9Q1FHM6_SYNKA|nr:hypothetical protein SKAU_G00155480 [Synaphobranchus kaupii]